jgi:hypothetical protein
MTIADPAIIFDDWYPDPANQHRPNADLDLI